MKSLRHGLAIAVREHLSAGQPISRLEALVLYGVSNLTDVISELRKQGWVIESRLVPFAVPLVRLNKLVKVEAPANLPIREIQLTEYWLGR